MYKADLHIHTKYSKDSAIDLKKLIKIVKKKNLDCIAVTDHNTLKGVQKLKKMRPDFKIISGEEIDTDIGHVIGYNVNSHVRSRKIQEVVDELKSQGAKISIPHAFDFTRHGAAKNDSLKKVMRKIDFIEINARAANLFNSKARKFAKKHRKTLIAGSDSHFCFEVGTAYTVLKDMRSIKPIKIVNNASKTHPIYTNTMTLFYKRLRKIMS